MAPPRKSASLAGEVARDILAAVVLADSFTQRFRPVTVERPKVLLPLVNVPMLDYTLEWLAFNGVEEVYVFCCAHAGQVEAHLAAAGWLRSRKFRVHTVVATNCVSAGDALRVLDHRDVIKSDFVLVSGDVVSNMRLAPALEAHRRRRAADKSALMTLVMRAGMGEEHRRRLGATGATAVLDPRTKRLLKLEEHAPAITTPPTARSARRLRVDAHLYGERDDLAVRTDLVDTGVYIAAPEVLMLFSDNFDYQNVRHDFVLGVLSEEELGNKLYVHEVSKEYAARVHTLRSYDAISRDIMARWAYPLVPDTNLFHDAAPPGAEAAGIGGPTQYRFERSRIYLDRGVSVSRTAQLSQDCCIGAGSRVGSASVVRRTVMGRNCSVGADVAMDGCYLGNGVVVEDGAVLLCCMLCDNVVIREGARVQRNTVLSYGVVVDRGAVVRSGSRLSLCQQPVGRECGAGSEDELEVPHASTASPMHGNYFGSSDGESDGEEGAGPTTAVVAAASALAAGDMPESPVEFDVDVVGPLGAGFLWELPDAEEAGKDAPRWSLAPPVALPAPRLFGMMDEVEESGSEEEGGGAEDGGTAGAAQQRAAAAGPSAPAEPLFKREVAETFLRCVKEGISHDNVVIELNGLKIAEDKTFGDCARYLLTTALGLCLPPPAAARREYHALYAADELDTASKEGRAELLRRAASHLRRWRALFRKFLRSEEDQVEVLLTVEEFCGEEGDYEGTGERGAAFATIFPQLLKLLYDEDVVGEEAILQWADEKAQASAEERTFLELAAPLVEWLRQADEEDESGSEEGGSEG